VLEGKKAIVHQGGRILFGVPAINAKDPAFFMGFIILIQRMTTGGQIVIRQCG
jgi:hypothetical protein